MVQALATAHWADPHWVEERYPSIEGTVWLGRSASERDLPLGYMDDRHVTLVSGNRGGKGTSSIINNLCLWPGSVVVVDPKGENATVTAGRRGNGTPYVDGLGQAVHVLDPFAVAKIDESYRSRFNPLDAIDPDDEEAIDAAGRLADAIVIQQENAQDPFWDQSARQMVKTIILHVLTDPEYEGRRNLITVRDLILGGNAKAADELRKMKSDNIPDNQTLLWLAVMENPAFNGLVAKLGEGFESMMARSPKQFESVLQVAFRNTEFLDSPGMQRCIEASDFDLAELKTRDEGVSLYLCLPQRAMGEHFRWLRMMINLIVMEMEIVKGKPATGHQVLMLLDEFAALKRMETIENAVAQIAGFGVKMFFVLQSLEQLKAVYKDKWETFLANSGLKIFFNLEDHFSRDYVSKLMGETEVIRDVHSSGDNSSETESLSESQSRSSAVSRSESTGRSLSYGQSVSESSSESVGHSTSHGESRSDSYTQGTSGSSTISTSWSPQGFSSSRSKTSGGSMSSTQTRGESDTTSVSESRGTSKGTSQSLTQGISQTEGSSVSETTGTTRGLTHGASWGRTSGTAETIHRRPLCAPDEIGQLFASTDDRGRRAYPGMGLALVAGQAPVVFRRTHYYEDVYFIGYFDAHPDHKFLEPGTLKVDPKELQEYQPHFKETLGWKPKVSWNDAVCAGDVIGYADARPEAPLIPLRAPVTGRVVKWMQNLKLLTGQAGKPAARFELPPGLTGAFKILHYDAGEGDVDPFDDLAEYCDELDREEAQRLREEADELARRKRKQREHEQALKNGRRWEILDRRKWWFKAAGVVSLGGLVDGGVFMLNHAAVEVLVGLGLTGGLVWCGRKIRQTFIDERNNENPPQEPKIKPLAASPKQIQRAITPPVLTAGGKAESPGEETVKGISSFPGLSKITGENFLAHMESMKSGKPPDGVSPEVWKMATQALKNFNAGVSRENKNVTPPGSLSPGPSAKIDELIDAHNRQFAEPSDDKDAKPSEETAAPNPLLFPGIGGSTPGLADFHAKYGIKPGFFKPPPEKE